MVGGHKSRFSLTCIGYETKINKDLVSLHVGLNPVRFNLLHIIGSFQVHPIVHAQNIVSFVSSFTLGIPFLACGKFSAICNWEPNGGQVKNGTIIFNRGFNKNLKQ